MHWRGWTGTINPTPANNKNSGVTAQTITTRKKNNNFTSQCSAAATDDCSDKAENNTNNNNNRISAKCGSHNFGCGSFLLSGQAVYPIASARVGPSGPKTSQLAKKSATIAALLLISRPNFSHALQASGTYDTLVHSGFPKIFRTDRTACDSPRPTPDLPQASFPSST